MIYTELTKKAMILAFNAHKEQVDKSGVPYIFHPIHLAEQMSDEVATVVALLHDVVEDTDITLEQLAEQGFSKEIRDAVAVLTRREDTPYLDYIQKIKDNAVARVVKLADLEHNSERSRLDGVTEKDLERGEKYREAMRILKK